MRERLRRSLVLLAMAMVAALGAAPAHALEGPRWYIAPYAGFMLWDDQFGEITFNDNSIKGDDVIHAGARLGYVFGGGVGFELAGGWSPGKLTRETPAGEADAPFYYGSANLIYSPMSEGWGGPFVSAGFGLGYLTIDTPTGSIPAQFTASGEDKLNQGLLDMAAGWTFPIGSSLGLRLEARNLLWLPHDKIEAARLNYLIFGGALAFNFGGEAKDSDLDGVSDSKDKCPGTPSGAKVDANGCPTDADGDGVFDGIDQCANTPKGAVVTATGCTQDTDGDGVIDGIDQCADTPKGATVDARGCPTDSDGDGVVDGLDQCPNTPTGQTVDARGCPSDSDGDGVMDGADKCPNTPAGAKVDAEGCPIEISERETELLDTGMIRLNDVNFETAKADILPESYATLDIVGQLLTRWPDLRIEIGGHTDSRGTAAYNQKLSEARAQSVLTYLLQKFPALKGDQYTAKGYGEAKPIAPNNNALNMAKNRRVEFKVLNTDVLKKEVERRKTLQK